MGKVNTGKATDSTQQNLALRTIRSDGAIAETLPLSFRPDLNYPPPGYVCAPKRLSTKTSTRTPPPVLDWNAKQPPPEMRVEGRGSSPTSNLHPTSTSAMMALANNTGLAVDQNADDPSLPIGLTSNHSVDDLIDLIEEYLAQGDKADDKAKDYSPNPFAVFSGANWADQVSESDGTETPVNINLSEIMSSSPLLQGQTFKDSSPTPSFDNKSMREDQQQHILPDVVATVDGIRKLILAPHVPQRPVSLLAHRIGPTLLLEGTAIDGTDAQLTVEEARKKALRSKLLYYSVMMSRPEHERPQEPGNLSSPNKNTEATEANRNGPFRKALQWRLSDLNILIGSSQPTLRDRATGNEVNLQIHELRQLQQTSPSDAFQQHGTARINEEPTEGADRIRLDQASALEYWLDNILSNVSSLALCFHKDGEVQGYQVVPTHHLPQLSDPAFAPTAVQASSTQVLKWLKEGTNTGGTSFVVVKESNSTELKLYDITGLSAGHVADLLDHHPDSRSRAPKAIKAVSPPVEGNNKKRAPKQLNPDLGALVPVTQVREADKDPLPLPSSKQFGHLRYPYAMMCFRMAQCLPTFSNDAFRLWQKVASLLSIEEEEALLPLAIAHVSCMEYYNNSKLPDAERLVITQACRAVQCLHSLDRSLRSVLLPPSLLKGAEGKGGRPNVSHQQLAQQLEHAIAADPEVRAMVNEMRQLCVKVVSCMTEMANTQLQQPSHVGADCEARNPHAAAAISYGRSVENILVAQAALLLRAFEVPSGLIMANPDSVSISSEVSSLHHALGNNDSPSSTDKAQRGSSAPSAAGSDQQSIMPYAHSYDVVAAFEKVSTVAGDVMAGHLQQILACATDDASTKCSSPLESPPPDTLLSRYLSKLNRDLKVTFSIMSGRTGAAPTGGTPAPSIIGADVPDHANFIGRMTPFHTRPIAVAETALTFYQQALSHNYVLLNGKGEAFKALHRKIAGIHAVVAEFYARGLMKGLASPDDALEDRVLCGAEAAPWRDSESAYTHFDKAAKAFVQCRDFGNAALNFINASKMCLRASQALTRRKAERLQDTQRSKSDKEAAAAEDSKAIVELHNNALAALSHAEQLPQAGVGNGASSTGVPASVVDNVRQFTFSVLVYVFQWEVERLTTDTQKATSETSLSELHDRYLSLAFKIPKKLSHLMPSETLRAMEAKILKLIIGLYWLAYVPAQASRSDEPPTLQMEMLDRVACVRFAKTRLRQYWTNYVAPSLSTTSASVPLPLWQEATDSTSKMVAADLFLFQHGSAPQLAAKSGQNPEEDDQTQHLSRAITAVVDWRPWLKMAESGRVTLPLPPQQTPKGNKNQLLSPSMASLADDALGVAKNLTSALMCLLKLVKAGSSPANATAVAEAVRRSLSLSAAPTDKTESARRQWLTQLGLCIDETERLFNGRRGR